MLLRLDTGVPMKLVYQLSEKLKADPKQIALAQALTLNTSKPHMGLKGTYGLFASSEWWESVSQGKMPLLFISGVILQTYVADQDEGAPIDTIELKLDDGSKRYVGIYVNNDNDIKLFRPGCRAEIVYALDELKKQPAEDGGINYSKVALEMAVSTEPVE